jgi:nucleotide-binding universal stress UspA family protein
MYSNILLPIDGSQLSLRAARHGIELAKALNARVTTPATQFAREVAVVVPGVVMPQTEYDLRTEQAACNCLRVVTDEGMKPIALSPESTACCSSSASCGTDAHLQA